ncbi:MAG: T9SS type A sorting domain-containing protein, partial [Pedobacter sp.]
VYISPQTELFYLSAPKGNFNITGFVSQQDSVFPFFQNYELVPNFEADIETIISPKPVYKAYKISELKTQNSKGEADSIGVKAWINGIVHSETLDAQKQQFSLVDLTAGIIVKVTQNADYIAKRGEMIDVLGTLKQANGLTYFDADSVVYISANHTQFAPSIITQFNEKHEGSLVKLEVVKVISTEENQNITSLQLTKSSATFTIQINKNIASFQIPVVNDLLNITGILLQDDSSSPFTSNYFIVPRDSADIEFIKTVGFENKYFRNSTLKLSPNPAENFIEIQTDFRADKISITDISGKELLNFEPQSIFSHIDICNFKPGIYLVKVQQNGNVITQKIIKH